MRKLLKYVLISASLLIMVIAVQAGNHSPPAFKAEHALINLDQSTYQVTVVYTVRYCFPEQDSVTKSWFADYEMVKFKKIRRGYFHPLRE